jgi:hypothetical protein
MTAIDSADAGRLPRTTFAANWGRFAVLAAGGLVLGVAAAALFGVFSPVREPATGERPPVKVTLGQVTAIAPAAWVRQTAIASRLDLRVPLQVSPQLPEMRVAVTLTPAGDTPAPETRVSGLYPRFFTAEVGSGPAGLVRRGFRAGSPYAGEVVLFSPPDGRRFAARCETAGQDGAPPQCLAEFRRRGIDIQLRFPPSNAEAWEAMVETVLPRIEAMLR